MTRSGESDDSVEMIEGSDRPSLTDGQEWWAQCYPQHMKEDDPR